MKKLGNVMILGDSYSTFKGYIPEGYAPYYSETREDEMDVRSVEVTWWHKLISETESELILNCSYSGTTICHTGYNGSDCKNISFVARLRKLIEEGFFDKNKIDTLFVFGGTNDSWANSPLGELKYDNISEEEIYNVLPAIGYLFGMINEKLSGVRIVCIINTGLKTEISDAFDTMCEKYGIERVKLCDIEKFNGHPNIKGMEQIKAQVLEKL